ERVWSGVRERAGGARRRGAGAQAGARLPFRRLTVAEAFERYAGIDLLATLDHTTQPDAALLATMATRAGVAAPPGDDWETLFFRIMLDRVEPQLGIDAPA